MMSDTERTNIGDGPRLDPAAPEADALKRIQDRMPAGSRWHFGDEELYVVLSCPQHESEALVLLHARSGQRLPFGWHGPSVVALNELRPWSRKS